MKFRKIKAYEQDFIDANPETIEIHYYPKKSKTHQVGMSVFTINKGYAFLEAKKMLRHFRKCHIIEILEYDASRRAYTKSYKSLEECLLGIDK